MKLWLMSMSISFGDDENIKNLGIKKNLGNKASELEMGEELCFYGVLGKSPTRGTIQMGLEYYWSRCS